MVNHATGRSVKATGREAELYQAAQRYRNGLLKREQSAIDQIRPIYESVMEDLIKECEEIMALQEDRRWRNVPLRELKPMRRRLESLIDQTAAELAALSPESVRIVTEGQQTALQWVNSETGELLYASTGDPQRAVDVIGTFSVLPTTAIESLVGFSSDGSPLAVLFDSLGEDIPGAMKLTLANGIAQGRNPRHVARQLETLGRLSLRRAETIARTEIFRAAREGQRRIYESNPAIVGYRRTATQDARVCLACLALSGTLHTTAEIMPTHPNCRCVMVPVTRSLAEITGDPSIPDLRPKPVTSETIMAGLDAGEIRDIIGDGRLRLMESGVPLSDMIRVVNDAKWGPTTTIKPLREFGIRVQPRLTMQQIVNRLGDHRDS